MPWSGGSNQTFTRTDGTRTGSTTWQQAQAAGQNNTSAAADVHDQDLADGINACLKKDGGNAPTANLPMGSFKHTGAGQASASGEYVEHAQWLARTASETQTGIVELATDAETQTGTDTARAITPANLSARTATETRTGVVELATVAEASAGTDTARAITAAGLKAYADAAVAALLPSGTPLLFPGTATAPTGWTKVTSSTYSDAALRIVTGASASTGGSAAFSTTFASRTPAGTVGGHTLTTAEMPAHSHGVTDPGHTHSLTTKSGTPAQGGSGGFGLWYSEASTNTGSNTTGISIQNSGSGGSHDHTWTGTAMDFAVKYVDSIVATKN